MTSPLWPIGPPASKNGAFRAPLEGLLLDEEVAEGVGAERAAAVDGFAVAGNRAPGLAIEVVDDHVRHLGRVEQAAVALRVQAGAAAGVGRERLHDRDEVL